MEKFSKFARIAQTEFPNIVISTHDLGHKLRIYLKDKSFVDFFYSTKSKTQRYAIHWEKTHINKTFYRLDNTPDPNWKNIASFPAHFHDAKYDEVKIPPFDIKINDLENLFRSFLNFVKNSI